MKLIEIYQCFKKCSGVSIDTRTISKNNLFVALKGPSFDGNKYVQTALDQGALYAIVDDQEAMVSDACILVEGSLETLQNLALYHRNTMDIPVIGITGSNGKTTTKELVKAVLASKYHVSATKGNYNNHIGVPLTILNASRDSDILLLEMGSNRPGDIEELCNIANPNLGLITNIGASHLEQLGSEQGVFLEKRYLYDQLMASGGHFFVNKNDQYLSRLSIIADQVIIYGKNEGGEGALSIMEDHNNLGLRVLWNDGKIEREFTTYLSGRYNIENIGAAIAVGTYFNIEIDQMISALSNYQPDNMRSQMIETDRNTLVMDAYNANPSSMQASIISFLENQEPSQCCLILGDMLELGEGSVEYHRQIVDLLNTKKGLFVILVGNLFGKIDQAKYPLFANVKKLIESQTLEKIKNKKVLIKASRGIGLEGVKSYL